MFEGLLVLVIGSMAIGLMNAYNNHQIVKHLNDEINTAYKSSRREVEAMQKILDEIRYKQAARIQAQADYADQCMEEMCEGGE